MYLLSLSPSLPSLSLSLSLSHLLTHSLSLSHTFSLSPPPSLSPSPLSLSLRYTGDYTLLHTFPRKGSPPFNQLTN